MLKSRMAKARHALGDRLPLYFNTSTPLKTAGDGPGIIRALLVEALKRLNDKLKKAGATISLWMIGGGTMMLHFDARESSGDLDVIPRKGDFRAMLRFAEEVAQEMTAKGKPIPNDWINGDFTPQLMTLRVGPADFVTDPRYHWSNLEIKFAKPELMLALKAFSMREGSFDAQDLAFLMNAVPVRDFDHLYDILDHYGDTDFLADGDDEKIEQLFREVRGRRQPSGTRLASEGTR